MWTHGEAEFSLTFDIENRIVYITSAIIQNKSHVATKDSRRWGPGERREYDEKEEKKKEKEEEEEADPF